MSKSRLVITAITVEKRPVSEVARSYGVARSWIYALLARYEAEGEAAFEPRSRRPGRRHPRPRPRPRRRHRHAAHRRPPPPHRHRADLRRNQRPAHPRPGKGLPAHRTATRPATKNTA